MSTVKSVPAGAQHPAPAGAEHLEPAGSKHPHPSAEQRRYFTFNASVSREMLRHRVRAKYYPTESGLKLATVQSFSVPFFRESGWESQGRYDKHHDIEIPEIELDDESVEAVERYNNERARRRARIAVYDLTMSNPQLDTFITLTYAPEAVGDKADYAECYAKLRPFLSNSVQRAGLAYVGVPELTKKGDVHFHFLANSSALKLERARHPRSGRALSRKGSPIYNVTNWSVGFSTAQIVTARSEGADAHTATCKYLTKYMTKSTEKIGGRYYLSGGELRRPIYFYGESEDEFFDPQITPCRYEKAAKIPTDEGELEYRLYSFT